MDQTIFDSLTKNGSANGGCGCAEAPAVDAIPYGCPPAGEGPTVFSTTNFDLVSGSTSAGSIAERKLAETVINPTDLYVTGVTGAAGATTTIDLPPGLSASSVVLRLRNSDALKTVRFAQFTLSKVVGGGGPATVLSTGTITAKANGSLDVAVIQFQAFTTSTVVQGRSVVQVAAAPDFLRLAIVLDVGNVNYDAWIPNILRPALAAA